MQTVHYLQLYVFSVPKHQFPVCSLKLFSNEGTLVFSPLLRDCLLMRFGCVYSAELPSVDCRCVRNVISLKVKCLSTHIHTQAILSVSHLCHIRDGRLNVSERRSHILPLFIPRVSRHHLSWKLSLATAAPNISNALGWKNSSLHKGRQRN